MTPVLHETNAYCFARKLLGIQLASFSWIALAWSSTGTSVPTSITFSGYLLDQTGAPVTQGAQGKFAIGLSNSSSASNTIDGSENTFSCGGDALTKIDQSLWCGLYSITTGADGQFSVALGSTASQVSSSTCTGGPFDLAKLASLDPSGLSSVTLNVMIQKGECWDLLLPSFSLSSTFFALRTERLGNYVAKDLPKFTSNGEVPSSDGTPVIDANGTWLRPMSVQSTLGDPGSDTTIANANLSVSGAGGTTFSTDGGSTISSPADVFGIQGLSISAGSKLTLDANSQFRVYGGVTFSGAGQGLAINSGSSCTIYGTSVFSNTMSVQGATNLTTGTFSGSFGGNPEYSGNVTYSGTPVFVGGAALGGTFTGNPTLLGSVAFSGTPTFSGATINGAMRGNPTFSTSPSFANVNLSGTYSSANFNGSETFSNAVAMSPGAGAAINVAGGNLTANTTLSGAVTFNNIATFNKGITVTGNSNNISNYETIAHADSTYAKYNTMAARASGYATGNTIQNTPSATDSANCYHNGTYKACYWTGGGGGYYSAACPNPGYYVTGIRWNGDNNVSFYCSRLVK